MKFTLRTRNKSKTNLSQNELTRTNRAASEVLNLIHPEAKAGRRRRRSSLLFMTASSSKLHGFLLTGLSFPNSPAQLHPVWQIHHHRPRRVVGNQIGLLTKGQERFAFGLFRRASHARTQHKHWPTHFKQGLSRGLRKSLHR